MGFTSSGLAARVGRGVRINMARDEQGLVVAKVGLEG